VPAATTTATAEPDRLRAARRAQLEFSCSRAEPFPGGTAFFTPEHPVKWELNLALVDDARDCQAAGLIAEAERAQGGAGLSHRRLEIAAAGEQLREGFLAAGWLSEELLIMLHRAQADRRGEHEQAEVREVPFSAVRPLAERWHGEGMDADVARAVVDADEIGARALEGRSLLAERDGAAAGYATLSRRAGAFTEIEQVYTAPEHRSHGVASALVRAAIAAGREQGDEVFIVADADDWPYKLYERLGFQTVGRRHGFTRPGPGQAT